MDTIEINKIKYEITNSETPEDVEARGMKYLAAQMRSECCTRFLGLKRINGKAAYFSKEFDFGAGNKAYTAPMKLS